MRGKILYSETDELINNMKYLILAPSLYASPHKAFTSGELQPFFIPDKSEMTRTMLTIADMIDMSSNNLNFVILADKDIFEIYKFVTNYSVELAQFEGNSKEVDLYLGKVRKFLDDMRRPVRLLSQRNPEVMNALRKMNLFETIQGFAK